MQNKALRRASRGMSVVELLIVLAVGAAIAAGAISVYFFQIRPSMYVDGKVNAFNQLVTALEHVKGYYGNAYPAGTVNDIGSLAENVTDELQRLLVARVGPRNSRYLGWNYQCSSQPGGKLTITVNVGDTTDATLKQSVYTSISRSHSRDWTCSPFNAAQDNTFTCTLNNSTCR